MKILVLSKRPLDLKLGDGVRVVNLLRCLVDKNRFDLWCFAQPGQGVDGNLQEVFGDVRVFPLPQPRRVAWIRRAFGALSLGSVVHLSEEMQAQLERVFSARHYDLVFCIGGSVMLNLPPNRRGVPLVVDSIDSAPLTFAREWKHAGLRDRARLLRRMWLYSRLAQRVSQTADANVFASELDASIAQRRFPKLRTEGIPNGVAADYFHPGSAASRSTAIGFEGNMMFGPNVDAAKYLCKEIVPLLRRRHPDLRVYIVGRDPTPEVLALASEAVTVTGTVPDVRPYLWRTQVFVCPMRLGAGIKNKILQAWAMGIPVVATTAAVGGLDARDGENVLVRDDPAAFADAVSLLIAAPERALEIGACGRRLAIERYSWQAQAERLDRLFTELQAGALGAARTTTNSLRR